MEPVLTMRPELDRVRDDPKARPLGWTRNGLPAVRPPQIRPGVGECPHLQACALTRGEMSSGLDANDSAGDSVAAEESYQSQSRQTDWIKLSLDAPMIAEPGRRLIYGSANPLILGGILDNVVGERTTPYRDARSLIGACGDDHIVGAEHTF